MRGGDERTLTTCLALSPIEPVSARPSRPVYPQKQTFVAACGMSALCQRRKWRSLQVISDTSCKADRVAGSAPSRAGHDGRLGQRGHLQFEVICSMVGQVRCSTGVS